MDIVLIDELGQKLRVSEKTLRELARAKGFPLWRLTPKSPACAYWSEVQVWIKQHRLALK
jgi:hypothetical protein